MNKLFILLAGLAFVHVARPQDNTCSANGKTYKLGDYICADEDTYRVCVYGGKWYDDKCPSNLKCQLQPGQEGRSQCQTYIKAETGSRFRRQDASRQDSPPTQDSPPKSSDTCSANGQTYQVGDWTCLDDTTHRICDWGGKWLDRPCYPGSKCKPINGNERRIQCEVITRVEYATGPPAGAQNDEVQAPSNSQGNRFRFRRQDASRQDDRPTQGSPPKSSDTCSANGQTYQLGDWTCLDDTTHRICDWGGKWLDRPCYPGSKCKPIQGNDRRIQCEVITRVEYPTGPPPGTQNSEVQGSSSETKQNPQ